MEANETHNGSMSEEVVERYFDLQINEARHNGDETLLKFLEASRRIWDEQRSLHVQLSRNIAAWDAETSTMNSLVDSGQLFVPEGALRRTVHGRVAVRGRRPPEAAVLLCVVMSVLLGYSLSLALDGGSRNNWIVVVIEAVIWGYLARQVTHCRKGDS